MAMDAASGLVSREEAATRLGLMEPDPPKNVKCVATTACTIELSWDAPVFTGGVPLDDYVISYSLVHKKYEGKKEIRTLEEMPELPTSRWYAIDPIAETGYTIKFLQADTEYTDIIVRAKNPIGLSAPSKAVEHVSTTVAVAPTAPLLLVALKRTSHSIEFKWSPPASDGGSSIARYRLVYTTLMHRDVEDDPKRGGGGKLQTVKEEFPASQTTCVIDDLQGNQVLSNVHVEAVNAADYLSPPSNSLRKVKTTPPSRIQIVKDEIRRIKKMKKKFVDSTVYHKFYQRFERETLLARLLVDLKELQDLELTKMESLREQDIQKAASKRVSKKVLAIEKAEEHAESEDADTPNLQSSIFMAEDLMRHQEEPKDTARQTTIETMEALQMQEFHRREKQFEYRMNYLREEVRACTETRIASKKRRAELTGMLQDLEALQRGAAKTEHDRAMRCFQEQFMDNDSVIHGKTPALLGKVAARGARECQLEEAQMTIGNGKKRLSYLQKLYRQKTRREEYLKRKRLTNRKAACRRDFQHEIKEKRRQAGMINGNWRNKEGFHDMFLRMELTTVQERKRKRGVVSCRVIQRLLKRDLHSAFDEWIEVLPFISVLDGDA